MNWLTKSVAMLLTTIILNVYAEGSKNELDLDKDLEAIEKEIKKIEHKVRKQEQEEKDINVLNELTKAEKLMRSVYKDFTEISTGGKGKEIVAILKKAEEKLSDIISKVKLNMHPPLKKEQEVIDILENTIKNFTFQMQNQSQNSQKEQDQQYKMSEKELQKLLKQLKKQRAKEQKKKQQKPTANKPAESAYDVPPSEPPTAETKSPTGGDKGSDWGRMTERERESVIETESEEIPGEVGILYKEFIKALGKEATK